jgi:transcriptional regulator with XRE-family HTH domain
MLKCPKCHSRLIEDLIDYKTEIFGEEVVVDKVDGYRCLNCGHTEVDKNIQEGLKNKLLEKKLEIQKEKIKNYKPLLINNIRRIRERKKIHQKKIGEALGYSEQRFGAIERNDNTPIVSTAKLIASALEVTMEEIYDVKYVSKEFYDKIKNLTHVEKRNEDGTIVGIDFVPIDDLVKINEKYDKLEEEINEKMAALRKLKKEVVYFQDIKTTEKEIRQLKKKKNLTQEEKELIKSKKERVNNFKKHPSVVDIAQRELELKELKREKNRVLKEKRTIESKGNCILKQSQCIDGEMFELLKEKFKKEYTTLQK